MLPQFPEFKKLELGDWSAVKKAVSGFLPYSDYNFISMWSWDTKDEMRVSQLNGNLVVRFTDYVTQEPFYSFIGPSRADETAAALIRHSEEQGMAGTLKLVPDESARMLDISKFSVMEDRNQFDYIYHIDKIQTYAGNKYGSHRNLVNSFTKKHRHELKELDMTDRANQAVLVRLLDLWTENKRKKFGSHATREDEESQNEYLALQRLFSAPAEMLRGLNCFAVFVDGELSAFMVDERVTQDYCVSHFGKMNVEHKGNLQFLMQASARKFAPLGIRYYNDEQDLGLANLRSSKSSYELAHFLKKHTVSMR